MIEEQQRESRPEALEMAILDVGHGNCAVVRDGSRCMVIDAAPGDMVLDELERIECDRIEHLVISHSDRDHAGGGPRLLLDDVREIGTVWFNPDSEKQSDIWKRLLRAVFTRFRRGGLDGHKMVHTEIGQDLSCGRARLEVRHPSILLAGTGPTKESSDFGTLSTNTLSIVLRVYLDDQPVALLAADMDNAALIHIQDNGHELAAPVLVFPHHGGLPGTSGVRTFAHTLTELVKPELVVFSIRSGLKPKNPNPEIVAGVREAVPKVHIACTQLSAHCHDQSKRVPDGHLALRSAAGRKTGRCCAGTITVTLIAGKLVYDPPIGRHEVFITDHISSPLCRA